MRHPRAGQRGIKCPLLWPLTRPLTTSPRSDPAPLCLPPGTSALLGPAVNLRRARTWQVFVEIAESQSTFLKKHIQPCVTGFINIASNLELEDSTRHLALEFLLTVAEQTPTVARKLTGFCAAVVPVALQMMLDVEGDTPEELQASQPAAQPPEEPRSTSVAAEHPAADRPRTRIGPRHRPGTKLGYALWPAAASSCQQLPAAASWAHVARAAASQLRAPPLWRAGVGGGG